MTIMLVVVFSVSVILFNQVKITGNLGNSISSLYAAESGVEKTIYFDRKQIPQSASRGFCNICNACTGTDCKNCIKTPLASSGCDVDTCANCQITYTSTFGEKSFSVDASVTPDSSGTKSVLTITVRGYYKDTVRAMNLNLVK